jgi:membrane-associated protease RseP (regulator of RpoE activity)
LAQRGIKFTERDVSADPNAANEMVGRSGQMGVPVIVVDDEVIIGFNRDLLDRALSKIGTSKAPSFGARVADASRFSKKVGGPAVGAYVGGVQPSSPAARAGLQEGDVITSLNGRPVRTADDLGAMLAVLSAGSRVSLTFLRGANSYSADVTI